MDNKYYSFLGTAFQNAKLVEVNTAIGPGKDHV